MPVVPMLPPDMRGQASTEAMPMPDDPWALMAAAQMHKEGRLVDEDSKDTEAKKKQERDRPQYYWPSDGRRDKRSMMT